MKLSTSTKALTTDRVNSRVPSYRRTPVDVRCRVSRDDISAPTIHSENINAAISRRNALSVMLAGALLLPIRPALADEAVSVEEAVAVEADPVTQIGAEIVSDTLPIEDAPAAVQLADASDSASVVDTPAPEPVVAAVPTKVFMDVSINGEPAGRLTMELFSDVPAGASRFAELAAGRQGVDYRLSKFNGVLPTYVRNDGLNRLSYSATEVSPIASGDSIDSLEAELDVQSRKHDQAGLVSLVVREKEARPVKERLVARDGKLITVLEQAGEAPNGTQFAITTAPSPELDDTNLIIGRLVEGEALLRRIAALPVNRPRNDNPYFQAGKAMGDKRAVTAERAFYRPFQKVVVSASGIAS